MKTLITATITSAVLATAASATILTNVTITGGSTDHSASFVKANLLDHSGTTGWSSNSQGTNTFLEYTFTGGASFDTYIHVDRNSAAAGDQISAYNLTFADSSVKSITRTNAQGSGTVDSLGELITTTTARFDATALGGGITNTTSNTGGSQIYFLRTPANMTLATGVTVAAASTAGASLGTSAIMDGKVHVSHTGGYLSNNGANTYVDFDLGAMKDIGGFDYIDNLSEWGVYGFDMIFSADLTFDGSDITKSYSSTSGAAGTRKSTQSDEFAGINARYVRFDVTSAGDWSGINEMRFYTVNQIPEPSSTALLGLGGLALILRRRKA